MISGSNSFIFVHFLLLIATPPDIVLFPYIRGLLSVFTGPVHFAGGISFSGIAIILIAAHSGINWPASHAKDYLLPVNGSRGSNILN